MREKETLINKLERGRAEFAYRCVQEAISRLNSKKKEYKSYTKKIPQMILSNGLGQTIAFIKAKKSSSPYELIYDQLTKYIKSESTSRIQMPPDKDDLLEWVISCESINYKYITQEVLAFFNWLRRLAEGLIEDEESED